MNWEPVTNMSAQVVRGDRRLSIVCSPIAGRWIAAAIESVKLPSTLDDVFHDHGHKTIGDFSTMLRAIAAGNRFAREWVKSGKIDKCGCKEISKPKRGRK